MVSFQPKSASCNHRGFNTLWMECGGASGNSEQEGFAEGLVGSHRNEGHPRALSTGRRGSRSILNAATLVCDVMGSSPDSVSCRERLPLGLPWERPLQVRYAHDADGEGTRTASTRSSLHTAATYASVHASRLASSCERSSSGRLSSSAAGFAFGAFRRAATSGVLLLRHLHARLLLSFTARARRVCIDSLQWRARAFNEMPQELVVRARASPPLLSRSTCLTLDELAQHAHLEPKRRCLVGGRQGVYRDGCQQRNRWVHTASAPWDRPAPRRL
jgi:hypothetical protein